MSNYYNALSEVSVILQHIEFKELKKIPRQIINAIEENKNIEYNYIIDNEKKLKEQNMLPETKAILSNLYRNYIATDDKKEYIKNKEKFEILEIEKRKRELYNPEDIFTKRNKEDKKIDLIVKENNNIFLKILKFIRQILKNN